MNIEKLLCMTEANLDTINLALRKERESDLAKGNIESADYIDSLIKSLELVPLC